MTEERTQEQPDPSSPVELGDPVEELAEPPPDEAVTDMRGRVTRAIRRRLLGSAVLEFCVLGPLVLVLGLFATIGHLIDTTAEDGDQ